MPSDIRIRAESYFRCLPAANLEMTEQSHKDRSSAGSAATMVEPRSAAQVYRRILQNEVVGDSSKDEQNIRRKADWSFAFPTQKTDRQQKGAT